MGCASEGATLSDCHMVGDILRPSQSFININGCADWGISNSLTILCNECGRRMKAMNTYSGIPEEFGMPPRRHGGRRRKSFAQGYCVSEGSDFQDLSMNYNIPFAEVSEIGSLEKPRNALDFSSKIYRTTWTDGKFKP
jgi:hypothetical protein